MNFKKYLLHENLEKKKKYIKEFLDKHFDLEPNGEYLLNDFSFSLDAIVDWLKEADPVAKRTNGKNSPFITTLLKWMDLETLRFPEDKETVSEILTKYEALKFKNKIKEVPSDFPGPGELLKKIKEILQIEAEKTEFSELPVFDKYENYTAYQLNSFGVMEHVCKDTSWCVKHEHHFSYYKPPFFLVTVKPAPTIEHRVCLIHPPTGQIKDTEDVPLHAKIAKRFYPLLEKLFEGVSVPTYSDYALILPKIDPNFYEKMIKGKYFTWVFFSDKLENRPTDVHDLYDASHSHRTSISGLVQQYNSLADLIRSIVKNPQAEKYRKSVVLYNGNAELSGMCLEKEKLDKCGRDLKMLNSLKSNNLKVTSSEYIQKYMEKGGQITNFEQVFPTEDSLNALIKRCVDDRNTIQNLVVLLNLNNFKFKG